MRKPHRKLLPWPENWHLISRQKFAMARRKNPVENFCPTVSFIFAALYFKALFWLGFSSLVIKRALRKSPPGRDSRICLLNMFIHDDYTKDWSALIISKSSYTKIRLFILEKFSQNLLSATSKDLSEPVGPGTKWLGAYRWGPENFEILGSNQDLIVQGLTRWGLGKFQNLTVQGQSGAWILDRIFRWSGIGSKNWSGVVILVKYLPGSWPCMNMAAFHKDCFYHFSISLSRYCLLNQIAQF